MDPIDGATLEHGALVLVDTAPIVYVLEGHPTFARRFQPVFDRHARGELAFAVTTVTIAEVLTGPLGRGDEPLAKRYRGLLESWMVVELTADIAESAARLRAGSRLKLPDAVQLASALAVGADALVTHDRDFSRIRSMTILT